MAAPIPQDILRKVRDMIRAGFTRREICEACEVSLRTVDAQVILVKAAFGITEDRAIKTAKRTEANARRSHFLNDRDGDANNVDLCDIFDAPKTRKEIRYFGGGSE